jgi:hypothetical protein
MTHNSNKLITINNTVLQQKNFISFWHVHIVKSKFPTPITVNIPHIIPKLPTHMQEFSPGLWTVFRYNKITDYSQDQDKYEAKIPSKHNFMK